MTGVIRWRGRHKGFNRVIVSHLTVIFVVGFSVALVFVVAIAIRIAGRNTEQRRLVIQAAEARMEKAVGSAEASVGDLARFVP